MADEKPRAPRARKKVSDTDAVTTKTAAKKKPAKKAKKKR